LTECRDRAAKRQRSHQSRQCDTNHGQLPTQRLVTVTLFVRRNVSRPDDFSNPQLVHLALISKGYSQVCFLDSPKPDQYGPRGFEGGGA
jgi:hypothetical protein